MRSIVWTVRSISPTSDVFHEVFYVRGNRTGALLSPHFELHLLDLSRLGTAPASDEPQVVRWGKFFTLDGEEQRASLLAEEDPIMSLAVKTLQDLSDDPTARRIAEDRERDQLALGHIIASTRRMGREEGIAEGIAIGKEAGIAIGKASLVNAIEALADVLAVEITLARRSELDTASVEALTQRLDSLRRARAWV